jgi:hypothetical protein
MSEQIICPECCYERPVRDPNMPGVAVPMPGMMHHSTCPSLPQWTAEQHREWQQFLDDLDENRRRAWEWAATHVIG